MLCWLAGEGRESSPTTHSLCGQGLLRAGAPSLGQTEKSLFPARALRVGSVYSFAPGYCAELGVTAGARASSSCERHLCPAPPRALQAARVGAAALCFPRCVDPATLSHIPHGTEQGQDFAVGRARESFSKKCSLDSRCSLSSQSPPGWWAGHFFPFAPGYLFTAQSRLEVPVLLPAQREIAMSKSPSPTSPLAPFLLIHSSSTRVN